MPPQPRGNQGPKLLLGFTSSTSSTNRSHWDNSKLKSPPQPGFSLMESTTSPQPLQLEGDVGQWDGDTELSSPVPQGSSNERLSGSIWYSQTSKDPTEEAAILTPTSKGRGKAPLPQVRAPPAGEGRALCPKSSPAAARQEELGGAIPSQTIPGFCDAPSLLLRPRGWPGEVGGVCFTASSSRDRRQHLSAEGL